MNHINQQEELIAFKKAWIDGGGNFEYVDFCEHKGDFTLTDFALDSPTVPDSLLVTMNLVIKTAWEMWKINSQRHLELLGENIVVAPTLSDFALVQAKRGLLLPACMSEQQKFDNKLQADYAKFIKLGQQSL